MVMLAALRRPVLLSKIQAALVSKLSEVLLRQRLIEIIEERLENTGGGWTTYDPQLLGTRSPDRALVLCRRQCRPYRGRGDRRKLECLVHVRAARGHRTHSRRRQQQHSGRLGSAHHDRLAHHGR